MKHKIGDIVWSKAAHTVGMIVAYSPNGLHDAPRFKYSVNHFNTDYRYWYTDDMIEDGKELLRIFYERQATS